MAFKSTSQNAAILRHLRTTGNISWVEAADSYGCRSLTRRIRDLRDAGHRIVSETRVHPTTQQRYVRYHLIEAAAQRAA